MEFSRLEQIHLQPGQPLQEQLHKQMLGLLFDGSLPPGTRLPASRRLAAELGVSRNTVTAVLEQLKMEGFLESRRGSGVFVHLDLPQLRPGGLECRGQRGGRLPRLSSYGQQLLGEVRPDSALQLPCSVGIPDLKAFPVKQWLQIQRRHQDRTALMGFDSYRGYAPLCKALADYLRLSRGVQCEPEQIVITQGAQQAISLCSEVLLDAGDEVLLEDPGYIRARQAFQSRGATLVPVPVGPEGLRVDNIPPASEARLMYTTPTHQYPLGGIMPAAERLRLLEWASRNDTWLIEDDYDSEFHFHGKPIAALQGMADRTPVIYMGSFSKMLFPALRLGYLVVPLGLVDLFATAKSYMSGESPLLVQAVVADFLEEGHFVRHLRRMRQSYREKWEHLSDLVRTELGELVTPVVESAGMHLCLRIEGVDDVALTRRLHERGFGGGPLSSYYFGDGAMTGLVIGFANTTAEQRMGLVVTLGELLRA